VVQQHLAPGSIRSRTSFSSVRLAASRQHRDGGEKAGVTPPLHVLAMRSPMCRRPVRLWRRPAGCFLLSLLQRPGRCSSWQRDMMRPRMGAAWSESGASCAHARSELAARSRGSTPAAGTALLGRPRVLSTRRRGACRRLTASSTLALGTGCSSSITSFSPPSSSALTLKRCSRTAVAAPANPTSIPSLPLTRACAAAALHTLYVHLALLARASARPLLLLLRVPHT
jgi:hypothetical protein